MIYFRSEEFHSTGELRMRRVLRCFNWREAFAGANNRGSLLATSESVSFKVAIAYCSPKKKNGKQVKIFLDDHFLDPICCMKPRTLPHNGHCFSVQNNFQSHLSIREISVSTRRCQYALVFFFRLLTKPVKGFSLRDKHFMFPESEIFHVSNVELQQCISGIWF